MTDFVKHDQQKPRFSLIPLNTLQAVIRVMELGAAKYGADNWKKCTEPIRYYDAAMRHITAFAGGERLDDESKESHLAHAICCLMICNELENNNNSGIVYHSLLTGSAGTCPKCGGSMGYKMAHDPERGISFRAICRKCQHTILEGGK